MSIFRTKVSDFSRRIAKKYLDKLYPNLVANLDWMRFLSEDMTSVRINIKNFGYTIGRQLAPLLKEIPTASEPRNHHLVSKPTTQADIETSWFVYWCNQLKTAPLYHRKLWEFAFALQALFEAGMLENGKRGIGFGCGEEPLASYFAAKGIQSIVTDLDPEKVKGMGWAETGQHTSAIDKAFYPDIIDRKTFDSHVSLKYVDMNKIPDFKEQYDFCWSICAMEHLGSIQRGLDFVENSLKCLKPGGIAVHTTEFNFLSQDKTVENSSLVLFLRQNFIDLFTKLRQNGHAVLGPDFEVGDKPLDNFIDIPPYQFGTGGWFNFNLWGKANQAAHLKITVGGFPSTCYGMIIKKSTKA